jgi:hypothetical protein
MPLQHSGTTPNPFQASGDGNTFLAAPAPLMQTSNAAGYQPDNQNQQQQNILDFSNPFDFNAFAIPHSELDMAALSEDKLNELLPSNCWLPVGTDDLLDIAAQFGHQVSWLLSFCDTFFKLISFCLVLGSIARYKSSS